MRDLELIKDLMGQLQDAMGISGDDLNERLGREPSVEVQISGEDPMDEDMGESDMDFDDSEGMFKPKSDGMDLKKRLMAIRGK